VWNSVAHAGSKDADGLPFWLYEELPLSVTSTLWFMLSDFQERKATHYFELIDEDGNGIVEVSDFALRAQRLATAQGVTDDEAKDALRDQVVQWWHHISRIADFDGDARVTLPEWKAYWRSIQRGVDKNDDTLHTLHRAARGTLRAVDRTGTGRITEEEYAAWLEAWGASGSGEAFRQLDRGDKGYLTEQDLIVAVQEFYLSDDPEAPGNVLYGPIS
jgi:Ca2+-binding EF-hand superfamily protein